MIDISRLYELFLFHGYTALGLFFKTTHFIAEAFPDIELDPYERVYKVGGQKHSSLLGAQIHRTKASTLLIRLSKI